MNKQTEAINELLHRGSKEEVVKYSKKIMEKLLNNKKV